MKAIDTIQKTAAALFSAFAGLEKAKSKLDNAARDAAAAIVAADADGKDGMALFIQALKDKGMEERAASKLVSGNVRPFIPAARAAADEKSGYTPLEFKTLTQRLAKAAFKAAGGAKAEKEGLLTSAAWMDALAEANAADASDKVEKRANARAAAAAPMTARERVAAAIAANLPALTPDDRAALRAMLA